MDGVTLPHGVNSCVGSLMTFVTTDGINIWAKIDLGKSKTVRSLYLAVPEHPTDERLENLGIYIGDTGTWTDDPLCWMGSPTEPAVS